MCIYIYICIYTYVHIRCMCVYIYDYVIYAHKCTRIVKNGGGDPNSQAPAAHNPLAKTTGKLNP